MRYLVASAMRNEGAFVVEWVAWYRMLGFTDIVVATNDCTDGSPALMDLLMQAGVLTHLTHDPVPGRPPLRSAFAALHADQRVRDADWVLVCDVDEFLVIRPGNGRIADLLPDARPDFTGMAIHWRCFGSSWHAAYADVPVHRRFDRCAPPCAPVNTTFKSVFRDAARFRTLTSHAPRGFDGDWGAADRRWVLSDGRPLRRFDPSRPQKGTALGKISHRVAQLNHYAVRSAEEFAAKRGTPSAAAGRDRYDDRFSRRFDRNEGRDDGTARYVGAFEAALARLHAIPGVQHLHHLCCAARIAALVDDPATDPRHAHHLSEAARLG